MFSITANDLKTKGIPVIENGLNEHDEIVITVRGKPRYVVVTLERYHHLRDCQRDSKESKHHASD